MQLLGEEEGRYMSLPSAVAEIAGLNQRVWHELGGLPGPCQTHQISGGVREEDGDINWEHGITISEAKLSCHLGM